MSDKYLLDENIFLFNKKAEINGSANKRPRFSGTLQWWHCREGLGFYGMDVYLTTIWIFYPYCG